MATHYPVASRVVSCLNDAVEFAANAQEWVVTRTYHDLRRLCVVINTDPGRLALLRKLVADLQAVPPRDLMDRVRADGMVDLGVMPGRVARMLIETLRGKEFAVEVTNTSLVSYFPRHIPTCNGYIIEDDDEAEMFCLDLIARGAAVEEVEA